MLEIKLDINDAHELHALIYQADMSIIRGDEVEQDLMRFYNPKRLKRIKALTEKYSEAELLKRSNIEKWKSKLSKQNQIYIDSSWSSKAFGALKTFVYYFEELNDIPFSVFINLRTQAMELAYSLKLKPFPKSIVYFARHDLKEENYIDEDYLWLSELTNQ